MVSDWLELIGLTNVTGTASGARADCPFHSGGHGSQTFSIHGTRYNCFSARCGESGTLESLAKKFGTTVPGWVKSYQSLAVVKKTHDEIPLYTIANLPVAYDFVNSRGLKREVADDWWLRVDESNGGILIPIFDDAGRFISRAWRRNYGKLRYQNESGMPRETLLYGLDTLLIGKDKPDRVFLLEGFGDVWKARSFGIPAVSTFGANLCQGQIELLLSHGITKVSFMYDNDAAGWEGAVSGFDAASSCMSVDFAMSYSGKWPKDPGDADEFCLRRLAKYRESFRDFYARTSLAYT